MGILDIFKNQKKYEQDKYKQDDPRYESWSKKAKSYEEANRAKVREDEERMEFEQEEKARIALSEAEQALEKVKSFGFTPDVGLLQKARACFNEMNYLKVVQHSINFSNEIDSLLSEGKPSISFSLDTTAFKLNIGMKTRLILNNEGSLPAKDIELEFSGDVETRVISEVKLLKPRETQPVEIWIRPKAEGEIPLDITLKYTDILTRSYKDTKEVWISVNETILTTKEKVFPAQFFPPQSSPTSSGIEILRGYTILSNNDLKFGIRLVNNTNFVNIDADVILDYPNDLFSMKGFEIQHIGNISPNIARTATYLLKPLGCIHNEEINALITYKDHTGKKQTLHMRPKEVHCVCPFLKEKPMSEGEYSRLAVSGEFVQEGISFKGISTEDLAKFMGETCRHMLYKVKEYDLDGKKVIYLSGEALGEKAYYLLTAVIQDYKGLTQVILRAHSDKKYGLNGFMNEMADSIRHLVGSVQNAKEIGIIENTQVINIIDSVVQRTSFEMGKGGNARVNIKDSVVQRTKIGKE